MKSATLRALNEARSTRASVILATWLDNGEAFLIGRHETADPKIAEPLADAFLGDCSVAVEVDGRPLFLHVFNPPPRMIVVGAVHVAQPLSVFAKTAGFNLVIVDPRRAWTDRERFPGVDILDSWPDDAMTELQPDHRTAVVTLTHDPKIDDPALAVALASPAFYIGALGSTRTHAKRLARLKEGGFDDEALARIKGPVGLDIGARSPEEIALSIMAEIVATRRGRLP